jgi:hypothetical protein
MARCGPDPQPGLRSCASTDGETINSSTNPKFIALIERVRARQAAEGGYSSEEVRRMFELRKRR